MTEHIETNGWRQRLAGWQAGLVAIATATLCLALVLPRAVPPEELPSPVVDERALARGLADDDAAAAALETQRDARAAEGYDLRRVGEWFHRYGEADKKGDQGALAAARQELMEAASVVLKRDGEGPLLALRAYEQRTFLRELEAWERTGVTGDNLAGVGGDFIGLASRTGWLRGEHALACDKGVQAALFKKRFSEVVGLKGGVFGARLDETRALYRFFFAHPPPLGAGTGRAHDTWSWLLQKAEELGAVDASYPLPLARGVALYRLGRGQAAVAAFRVHLSAHPDGPYALRARNYLHAAMALDE